MAKAFTVTALGIAADEGRIRIDDPIVKYLPEFKVADPSLTPALTIRDLMAHRTGLPRADLLMVSGLANDLVMARLAALGPVAPIRTRFTYSNQMYLALGLLLERVTGASLPDFLESRLLTPIGFADGNARGLGHWPPGAQAASPHARRPQGAQPIDLVARAPYGAGGINASAADLAAWLLLQLNSDADLKVVSPNVIAAEHAPNTLVPVNATMPSATVAAYGLGLVRARLLRTQDRAARRKRRGLDSPRVDGAATTARHRRAHQHAQLSAARRADAYRGGPDPRAPGSRLDQQSTRRTKRAWARHRSATSRQVWKRQAQPPPASTSILSTAGLASLTKVAGSCSRMERCLARSRRRQ